jgi:2-oxoglutarate ferredoxin oxidoreductase subunit delta
MPVLIDKEKVEITINQQWCKGCGICIAFCPRKVFSTGKQGHPEIIDKEKCIKCMLCVERCPDFAIEVK